MLNTALPTSSGYFSAMKNVGKVRNQGIEFTLNTTNIKNRHFSWTTNFNIAFNKNKVLELAENQSSLLSAAKFDQNYNSQYSYIAKVGYPMGMMYGFIYEGTYKYEDFDKVGDTYTLKRNVPYFSSESNTQPGMPKYADLNGDGIIDDNDRTMIGNGMPKHIRPIMDSAMVAMAMMQGLTSAIVNPNDLRLMETIKSCDVFKGNTLYADSYLEI